MDPATASARLLRDLLWDCVCRSGRTCYRCGEEMTRESFSVDHKQPWLDSEAPVQMFFDLNNIAYSHKSCNYGDSRKPHKYTDEELEALSPSAKNQVLRDRERSRARRRIPVRPAL